MVVLNKLNKGECQVVHRDQLVVAILKGNLKNVWMSFLQKEGHCLMTMIHQTPKSSINVQELVRGLGANPFPKTSIDFTIDGRTYHILPYTSHNLGLFIVDCVNVPYDNEV